MFDFLQNAVLWTLALYGLFEIIKICIYYCTYRVKKTSGIHFIIAIKNQEKNIEGILRSIMFKILYGKEEMINNIILTDLNSIDNTKDILIKLSKDYENVDFIENVDLAKLIEK